MSPGPSSDETPATFSRLRVVPERRFAGRFVVAGADAGPRGEVLGGGERVHVDADLRDQHLGDAPHRVPPRRTGERPPSPAWRDGHATRLLLTGGGRPRRISIKPMAERGG